MTKIFRGTVLIAGLEALTRATASAGYPSKLQ